MTLQKKTRARLTACFIIIALAVTAAAYRAPARAATAEDLHKAIEEKTKLLETINAQIGKTQTALDKAETEAKSLNRAVRDYDYRISQLKLNIQASEVKIDTLGLEIGSLQADIAAKESLIDRTKDAVSHFIRELDERERESLLLTMLSRESLADRVFAVHAATRVGAELAGQVRALQEVKEELGSVLERQTVKRTALKSEQQGLTVRKAVTQEQREQKQELLVSTKQQEKLYQEQLKKLEQQQLEIGAAIETVEKQLRDSFDPALLPTKHPGVFQPPVPGAPMSQGYGATSFAQKAYKTKFHNGIDFAAPLGTPIAAARAGTVVATGNNGKYQYGKYIVIQHDNGLTTLYAHLSKQSVAKGDVVAAGQVIGYVGNTGYSYGAHVHFTVYWSTSLVFKPFPTCPCGLVPVGVTIDPSGYL